MLIPGAVVEVDHSILLPSPEYLVLASPMSQRAESMFWWAMRQAGLERGMLSDDPSTTCVLLVGDDALKERRGDLHIANVAGSVFVQRGRVFMPVPHPDEFFEAVRRQEVVGWLEGFRWVLRGELAPSHLFGVVCAHGCGSWVDHYDPEGVPLCARCWAKRKPTVTELEAARAKKLAVKVKVARKRAALNRQGALQ